MSVVMESSVREQGEIRPSQISHFVPLAYHFIPPGSTLNRFVPLLWWISSQTTPPQKEKPAFGGLFE
jgi:hypothetical protein